MSPTILELELNSTMAVGYAEAFGTEELKLLEVDESMLGEILEQGVTIRGGPNDEAVLCTSSATYAIKFVSTSNTVLVLPPPDHSTACLPSSSRANEEGVCEAVDMVKEGDQPQPAAGVLATASGQMELIRTTPRLERLKQLLGQRPYREETENMVENEDAEGLYTWEDLLDKVQASEKELRGGLKALAAIEIGRYWRLVDEKFMKCLLEVIILNAVQHDWCLNSLRSLQVLPVLNRDGYSSQIVRHCLDSYGGRTTPNEQQGPQAVDHEIGSDTRGESEVWSLDEKQVCLHYAKQLLEAASKWRLDDFLEAWQQNLPAGMQCSLELLRGEALVEKLGSELWLRPFSVSSLPSKPHERFAALFRERTKWEWPDLEPYVRDLHAPGQSVEALLMKHTRKTQATADAAQIFTPR